MSEKTTVTFIGDGKVRVESTGRATVLPLESFAAIDGELADTAERAQASPGTAVKVPNKSFARGLRPRHSLVFAIAL
jgi:hypothetical protein